MVGCRFLKIHPNQRTVGFPVISKTAKTLPPPAVFRKEPAILRQLIDHLQSFWGVETMVMYQHWVLVSFGEPWL